MKHLKSWAAAAAAAAFTLAGAAHATLVDRGGGMIYDTELNITWLQNWNQAAGSGYDVGDSGRMNWDNARAWAANLVWGGFDDWRLPATLDTGTPGCNPTYAGGTDCGYNVQTKSGATVYSEMAHLWYETLGNLAYCPRGDATCATGPQADWGLKDTGPFTNMQSDHYWSGTPYEPYTYTAWYFNSNAGSQNGADKQGELLAVAVRDGDVGHSVPEPQTLLLALTLLAGAAGVRRGTTATRTRGPRQVAPS